jgi:hypothetical protein
MLRFRALNNVSPIVLCGALATVPAVSRAQVKDPTLLPPVTVVAPSSAKPVKKPKVQSSGAARPATTPAATPTAVSSGSQEPTNALRAG